MDMNEKDKNIMSRTFYLTSLFADIKSDNSWTAPEVKTVMLILTELTKYKVYLPKVEEGFNFNEVIKGIPVEYTFHRDDFRAETKMNAPHFAREIKKIIKGLLAKSMIMPHPFELENPKSVYGITWFRKIVYSDKSGMITFKLEEEAALRLVAFVKYSKINFEHIVRIKNPNAIHTYLLLKIIRDSSACCELEMDVDEFKHRIGLQHMYSEIKHLKIYVLDVAKKEINECTDFEIDYELVKVGRAYKRIKFTFDYMTTSAIIAKKKDTQEISDTFEFDDKKEEYTTEKTALRSYGISVKAIEKYFEPLNGYQIEHIQQAISRLETEIARGKIIANKPAYFATVLKSVVDDSQTLLQAQAHEAEKQQRIEKSTKVKNAWDELDRYISSNEGYVLSIIDSFVRAIPVVADEVIEVRDKITELYMKEDIGKIQIPFNSLSRVETALGEKWSIGAGNIMYFISEANCVNGDASDKIKALKESLAFHTDMIETVEDEKLQAHHKENVALIKDKLLVFLI